jgi:hypothetical protein
MPVGSVAFEATVNDNGERPICFTALRKNQPTEQRGVRKRRSSAPVRTTTRSERASIGP